MGGNIEHVDGMPDGLFGRIAEVHIGSNDEICLDSKELDIEFEVPFDDDVEANEAEIKVYNLSKSTRDAITVGQELTVVAGYYTGGLTKVITNGEAGVGRSFDSGVIFKGYVSKVKSKREGVDRITTIWAIDDEDLKERDLPEDVEFKGNTTASYILKQLLAKVKLPVAVFSIRRDHTYKDSVTVSGGLMDNIRKYAEVCGVSAYINKGQIYVRHVSEGDNINFTVKADTGLLDSPEEFEEEVKAEDYTDTIKGYKFKMILQHRITVGAIINLESANVSGEFRVRNGTHTFNESEAITEMEVI
jgi:hypothetical protein